MEFFSRFEATPVPVRGCGIRPYELRLLIHEERRVGIRRPAHQIIDLTGDDDENKPQVRNLNDPFLTSRFAVLVMRPEVASNYGPISTASSLNFQQSGQGNPQSNKRKESESSEEDSWAETWSKRRLRPKKNVRYAESQTGDDAMCLDEPLENLLPSIEKDEASDSGEDDFASFDVERVIAHRTCRGRHEYLLGWAGCTELTWIPRKDCDCDELIIQFWNVPRFDLPAESSRASELIEQERARWLKRTVAQKADTPARPVRPRRPRSAKDPKTERCERRTVGVKTPPPIIYRVIPDPEDEDGDALTGDGNDVARDAEDDISRIPPTIPKRFSSRNGSISRLSKALSTPPRSTSEDMISIRQTPKVEETHPTQPAHLSKPNQSPRQTAKVFCTRNTPSVKEEETSSIDMHSVAMDLLESVDLGTAQTLQPQTANVSRWMAVNSKQNQVSSISSETASSQTVAQAKVAQLSSTWSMRIVDAQAAMDGRPMSRTDPAISGISPAPRQTSSTVPSSASTKARQRLSTSASTSPVQDTRSDLPRSWSSINSSPKFSPVSLPRTSPALQSRPSLRDAESFATSKSKSLHHPFPVSVMRPANLESVSQAKTVNQIAQSIISPTPRRMQPLPFTGRRKIPNAEIMKQTFLVNHKSSSCSHPSN